MDDFGIFLIDKPTGITSFDVIRQLRKVTGIRKMGHTGTLDPFASGVLPILFGKATRLANKFLSQDKEYLVKLKFGEKTSTGDIEGNVIETSEQIPDSLDQIECIVDRILSLKEQIPPIFSALKVNGKKAYELARAGKKFELDARRIKVFSFKIISYEKPFLEYQVRVSKGTYIRRLSEDIAEMLGTVAFTNKLKRLSTGNISIEQTVKLDDLTADNWQSKTTSIRQLLAKDYFLLAIDSDSIELFKHGNRFEVEVDDSDKVMVVNEENKCIGFGSIEDKILKPEMVMI